MTGEYDPDSDADLPTVLREVSRLASRNQTTCLWFLRESFVPDTEELALRALDAIQRHGDRESYIQARRLKEWLLQRSSEKSSR